MRLVVVVGGAVVGPPSEVVLDVCVGSFFEGGNVGNEGKVMGGVISWCKSYANCRRFTFVEGFIIGPIVVSLCVNREIKHSDVALR